MAKTLLNKMSTKAIVGNVKQALRSIKENGDKLDLYRLWGTVTGIETGEHETNGPWVKFTGAFGAINLISGEEFESFDCFLPETISKMLTMALDNSTAVEFVINTAMVRDDSSSVGYTYSVTPLVEAQESERTKQLKAIALAYGGAKQLESLPTVEVAETPEPEVKPAKKAGK